MHVGDRHPKTNFEAVDIGGRRYQIATSGAFRAGLLEAEKKLGPIVEDLDSLKGQARADAIKQNERVVRLGLEIAHGRTPATSSAPRPPA